MKKEIIRIEGVREHNLQNLSLSIPRGEFTVVTGVSGSGKSTLAFNVLFAEGQRRFLDSMSAYARQFVEQLPRADLDLIEGIPPSVSIEQRSTRGGGKSTVGTLTEVYHFLRLLYARLGIQYCESCNIPILGRSRQLVIEQAIQDIKEEPGNVQCLVPILRARKGNHMELLQEMASEGWYNVRIDGEYYFLKKIPQLSRYSAHDIDIVIPLRDTGEERIRKKLTEALNKGKGVFTLSFRPGKEKIYSEHCSCSQCGRSYAALDPYDFSFNSPRGWCPECRGFGEIFYLPDVDRGSRAEDIEESWFEWMRDEREICPACEGSRLKSSSRWVRLPKEWFSQLKEGPTLVDIAGMNASQALELFERVKVSDSYAQNILRDILPEIRSRLAFLNRVGLDYLSLGRGIPTLSGGEAQRIRLAAQLGSTLSGVLYVLDEPTIGLHARDNARLIETLQGLKKRGNTLVVVEHDEDTIRAADHILDIGPGAGIEGGKVVFQGSFQELEKEENSLTGRSLNLKQKYPSRGERREVRCKTCGNEGKKQWLILKRAQLHNLKNVTLKLPLGRFIVVTGVSGSGKSSLVRGCLYPALKQKIESRSERNGISKTDKDFCLEGDESIRAVYEVDQSPIGRTPRSVPATYVGFFDDIRKIFAQGIEAKLKGFQPGRFSFNSAAGRCSVCEGAGFIKVSMNFMPPAFVTCEHCGGTRFNPETLDVRYQGKNISEILQMTVAEGIIFFANHPKILRALQALADTGLSYMKLGQGSPTLSGGEAQRIKLVKHLLSGLRSGKEVVPSNSKDLPRNSSFFILEEPSIGLHSSDIHRLTEIIQRLVDSGHTVLVIEHNYDLIAEADWVIDLGPEGGEQGGEIVAEGTPEQIAEQDTWTGRYLKRYFASHSL